MSDEPRYIDAHAHVNFPIYDPDREDVIKKALESETWMINVGTDRAASQATVDLAQQHEKGVYSIVGLHPVHTVPSFHDEQEHGDNVNEGGEEFDANFFRELAQHPKVLGIGECGLDYFHLGADSVEKQREAFRAQINLANEVNKPLMLHIRPGKEGNAYGESLDLLRSEATVQGNVHFFAGTLEDAKEFLELGFTISFTGVITFTRDYDDLVRYVPLDRILSETDCPYVTPAPHRGKRNEPVFVSEVVRRIADVRGVDHETARQAIVSNIRTLFKI